MPPKMAFRPRPVARACGAAVVGVLVAALPPSRADATSAPVITSGPTITGAAVVGSALTATAEWPADPATTAKWTWLRCTPKGAPCVEIAGAKQSAYTVAAADLGATLRVRLNLANHDGSASKRSEPTAVVTAAPVPTLEPTATPTPTPEPTATPAPEPDVAPPGETPTVAAATPARPPLLDPFPVVRIKGRFTATGARVTLLVVRAPRGARIAVTCRGRDCPMRRFRPAAGVSRLRPFERSLRAGTRLEVTVTKPGYVGKVTVIVIRRHRAPWRSDRCLDPGSTRAVRCTG
jgi:hypothetical protein